MLNETGIPSDPDVPDPAPDEPDDGGQPLGA